MISACVCLHYGKDYLGFAIRSVYDHVDEIVVAYTSKPSHGQDSPGPCSETQAELYEIASKAAQSKLKWIEGSYDNEGAHRDAAMENCGGDIILVLDADEIWDGNELSEALEVVKQSNHKEYLANAVHFWRSFNWACKDDMWPVRIIKPGGKETLYLKQKFYHFGYARKPDAVFYKMQIHGHKNEWRKDWFQKKFLTWDPGDKDVHPTCKNTWTPEPFDKTKLPDFMRAHQYYDMDIIT